MWATLRRAIRQPTALLLPAAVVIAPVMSGVGPAAAHLVPSRSLSSSVVAAATSQPGGCDRTAAPGSTTLSINVGGRDRTLIVHVPSGYGGSSPVALVLNMHGSGSTAAEQELFSGMDAESDAAGFIVAYPQALIPSGTGFDWNIPGVPLRSGASVPKHPADDMAFLTQLIGVMEQRYCVNPRRVYATGFSGGARITSQLACDDSNLIAAVAPVSGLRRPEPCPTVRPVPVVAFHGTADPVDPYRGHGQAYWTYSVPQAERYWATQDGCRSRPVSSTPRTGVTVTTYPGCGAGSAVQLYTLTGEGHEWPGGPHLRRALTDVLGPQSNAVNADSVMWAFFSAHPLP